MPPQTAAALRALIAKWRHGNEAELSSEYFYRQKLADELAAVLTQEGAESWRCFHCDETFTTDESAREHFGASLSQHAACQIDIAEHRRMEQKVQRYCEEDTELHREILRLNSAHAVALRQEEEKGYARGLRDARAEAPAEPRAASDEPLFTASMYGTAADADKARDEWRAAQSEPRAAEGARTVSLNHEFGVDLSPNPIAAYWIGRAKFWREQALRLGYPAANEQGALRP